MVCWDGATPLTGAIEGATQLASTTLGFLVVQGGVVHELRTTSADVALGAPVAGLAGVVELRAMGSYACARNEAGDLHCWGSNDHSQFGVPLASMRLGLTPLSAREVPPETPAMLECGSAADPYKDDY